MDVLKCCECGKNFSALYNLRKHATKFHPNKVRVIAPKKTYNFQCTNCTRSFSHLKNLNYHKKQHGLADKLISTKTKRCPLCDHNDVPKKLRIHFKEAHQIIIKSDNFKFASLEEFNNWKNKTENNTKSHFVKERGTFSTNDHSVIKYFCHRSGTLTTKSKGLRHIKTQGSNKINGYCPAAMKLILNKNGTCQLNFLETHVGHENDLGHLFLSTAERETLAAKMALKIPFIQVLDEVCDSLQDSQLERIHLVGKKDLYNIENSFKLQSTMIGHQNDAKSVEAWVNQMETVAKERENLKSNLIPELIKIIDGITCMEQIDAFKKLVAPIVPTLTAIKNKQMEIKKPSHVSLTPHNKNISAQRKLFSTKKKKSSSKKLAKPNIEEKQKIALCLILKPVD